MPPKTQEPDDQLFSGLLADDPPPDVVTGLDPTDVLKSPAPKADDSLFSGALADEESFGQLQVAAAVEQYLDPETEARVLKLQTQTGLPDVVVRDNLDLLEDILSKGDFNVEALIRRSPRLGEFLKNPSHAALALADNDLSNLSGLEWAVTVPIAGVTQGIKQAEYAARAFAQMNSIPGFSGPEAERKLKDLEQGSMRTFFGDETFTETMWAEFWKMLPQTVGGMASGGLAALAAGQYGPQALLPEEIITVPGAAIAGAFAWSYVQETGLAYRDLKQLGEENGTPFDPDTLYMMASATGAGNAALEVLALGKYAKVLPGGKQLLQKIGIGKAADMMRERSFRNAMFRYARDVGTSMGTEAGTEMAQELTPIFAGIIAKKIQGGEWEPEDWRQNMEEVYEVGYRTFAAMVMTGGLMSGPTLFVDMKTARRTQEQAARLQAMTDMARSSKMLERSPEAFRKFVQEVKKEDGAVQNVYVPVEAWDKAMQKAGLDPEQEATNLGAGASYTMAKSAGGVGEMIVPVETYLEKVARSELHNELRDEVRLFQDRGSMTMAELDSRRGELAIQHEEILKQIIKDGGPNLETLTTVEREIFDAEQAKILRATTGDVVLADTAAFVFSKMMVRSATAAGIDPLNHYRTYQIGWQGPGDAAAREGLHIPLETVAGRSMRLTVSGAKHKLSKKDQLIQDTVQGLEQGDESAIQEAAETMSGAVDQAALLVPYPDDTGTNASIVEALAAKTGAQARPGVLVSEEAGASEGFPTAIVEEGGERGQAEDRRQADRRAAREPGLAEQDRQRADEAARGEAPQYGTPVEGAVSARGIHYGNTRRDSLAGEFYGTGLRGAERSRVLSATDVRLQERIYFYVDTGSGVRPEVGVGLQAHEVQLDNLYDSRSNTIPFPKDATPENVNAWESAIIDAGYDGYIAPFGSIQDAVVLIGPKHTAVPVRNAGEGALKPDRRQVDRRQGERRQQVRLREAFASVQEREQIREKADIATFRAAVGGIEATAERLVIEEELARLQPINENPNVVIVDAVRTTGARLNAAQKLLPKSKYLTYAQRVEKLGQTTAIRRGRENMRKWGLDPNSNPKLRTVATALENRQRELYGVIDRSDRSDVASQKIAKWMAAEVRFSLEQPGDSGTGWYSSKFQDALDVLGELYPELRDDAVFEESKLPGVQRLGSRKSARDFMTALMGVTSNGEEATRNFRAATEVYAYFRKHGKMPKKGRFGGERIEAIAASLGDVEQLLVEFGPDGMHDYLLEPTTVKDMNAALRKKGHKPRSDYPAAMVVPTAAVVLGPKVGAFYANLMGQEGYLTMDRWWNRTFNRYRGTIRAKATQKSIDRMRQLLGKPELTDDEVLIEVVPHRNAYRAKGFKNGTEIEKAANTIYKNSYELLKDVPQNPSDRQFMTDTVKRAKRNLKRSGIDISVADIQAILWYYEKRLYGELGAKASKAISYEESARVVVGDTRDDRHGKRPSLKGTAVDVVEGPDGSSIRAPHTEDASYLEQLDEDEGLVRLNQIERNPANPQTMFRSVAVGEAVDIQKTGRVAGKGNFFSGDPRRLVFFGETVGEVSHHGEDLIRFVHSQPEFRKRFEELRPLMDRVDEIHRERFALEQELDRDELIDEGHPKKLSFAERRQKRRRMRDLAVESESLGTGRIQRAILDDVHKRVREIKKEQDEANMATSYVMEFAPQAEGTLFTGDDSSAGGRNELGEIFPANEIGFETNVVGMETLLRVHVVQNGKVVAVMSREQFRNANLEDDVTKLPTTTVLGQERPARKQDRVTKKHKRQGGFAHRIMDPSDARKRVGHISGFEVSGIGRTGSGDQAFHIFRTELNEDQRGAGLYQRAVQEVADQYPEGAWVHEWEASQRLQKALRKMPTFEMVDDKLVIRPATRLPQQQDRLFRQEPIEIGEIRREETTPPVKNSANYVVVDSAGDERVVVRVSFQPATETLTVNNVIPTGAFEEGLPFNTEQATGMLGVKGVSKIRRMLKEDFPGAKTIRGLRTSGTRRGRDAATEVRLRARKGEIVFQPGGKKFDIKLFEGHNPSTVFHEMSHFYLEMLGDLAEAEGATATIRDDYAKILGFLGVKGRIEVGEKQQERFADAFEQYLREAVSPSEELRPAFARIKAWMLMVYSEVKELVKLTPEIRGVFDRMLASEEQVRHAKAELNMQPLDVLLSDGTIESIEEYRQALQAANVEATDDLRSQLMADASEVKAWFGEQRSDVRAEVEAEFSKSPTMRALHFLQLGRVIDSDVIPAGLLATPRPGDVKAIPLKLSKTAILEQYGADTLKALPKRPYIYVADDKKGSFPNAADPEALAPQFGFKNGTAMIEALTKVDQNYSESLEEMIQRRLESRFQDLIDNPNALASEALAAAQSPKQVEVLLIELRRLQEMLTPQALAQKNRSAPFIREEMVAAAQNVIDALKINDLSPYTFQRNAQKHGRLAFEAAKRKTQKSLKEAFDQKNLQLWNMMLYRAARDARNEADKSLSYFRRMSKGPAQRRLGKAGPEYRNQVNGFLEQFELRPESRKATRKRQRLRDWLAEQQEQGLEVIDLGVEEKGRKHYRELTVADMRDVRNQIKNIEHLAHLKTTLIDSQDRRTFEQAKSELIASVKANIKTTGRWHTDAGKRRRGMATAAATLRKWDASLLRMEELFDRMDGRDANGPWSRMVWNLITDAQSNEADLMAEVTLRVATALDKLPADRRAALLTEDLMIDSLGHTLSREAAVTVALNWGNLGNRERLVMGGIGTKGEWNESVIEEILSKLDRQDWLFVQEMWDTISGAEFDEQGNLIREGLWERIADLEERLHGVRPPKVEPMPIVREFADGTTLNLRGGYFPLVYSPRDKAGRLQLQAGQTTATLFDHRHERAMTAHGFTKTRTESYRGELDTSLDIIPRHLNMVIHDLTHREALLQIHKILNDKEIVALLYDRLGKERHDAMLEWMHRIANDRISDDHIFSPLVRGARLNTTVVAMGLKATTSLQNFANFFNVIEPARGVKPMYLQRAMREFMRPGTYRSAVDLVHEQSGEMRHRFANLDRDVKEAIERSLSSFAVSKHKGVRGLAGTRRHILTIQRGALATIALTDRLSAYPAWLGRYWQALEEEGLTEKEAVRVADRTVRTTLIAGGTKDLALVMSHKSQAWRSFTMFYGWFSGAYMRMRAMDFDVRNQRWKEEGWAHSALPWFLARIFSFWIIPALLSEVLSGRGPGRDDDEEGFMEWAVFKTLFYPTMTIPLLRDALNIMERKLQGKPVFDVQFSPLARVLNDGVRAASVALDEGGNFFDPTEDVDEKRLVKSTSTLLGQTLGLPSSQFNITAGYVWDLLDESDKPEDTLEFFMNILYRKPKAKKKGEESRRSRSIRLRRKRRGSRRGSDR